MLRRGFGITAVIALMFVAMGSTAQAQEDADGDGLYEVCVMTWGEMGDRSFGFAEVSAEEMDAANASHVGYYAANPDGTCPPVEEAVFLRSGGGGGETAPPEENTEQPPVSAEGCVPDGITNSIPAGNCTDPSEDEVIFCLWSTFDGSVEYGWGRFVVPRDSYQGGENAILVDAGQSCPDGPPSGAVAGESIPLEEATTAEQTAPAVEGEDGPSAGISAPNVFGSVDSADDDGTESSSTAKSVASAKPSGSGSSSSGVTLLPSTGHAPKASQSPSLASALIILAFIFALGAWRMAVRPMR